MHRNGQHRIGGGAGWLRLTLYIAVGVMVAASAVFGGYFLWERTSRVSEAGLERIVQRDGMPFDLGSIPDEVLERLASSRVLVVGETHFLREHREFMSELLWRLHSRGFRQVLVEWTQAADWLLTDFVNDGGLEPDWVPPNDNFAGDIVVSIREFNRTLPDQERIQIHAVDATLDEYGGSRSFLNSLAALTEHLPDPGPLTLFLEGEYDTKDQQMAQLETLAASLLADRSELVDSWGREWYETVLEMVETERESIPIRAMRDRDYDESTRLREEAIKRMTDARLRDYAHGTVINIGSTHAQKERLRGTDIEWLGDYLVHSSPVAQGSVTLMDVSAARIVSTPGSGLPDYELSSSPANELFLAMNSAYPDRLVLLPVDDPLFSEGRVPMNFEDTIYVGAPKRQYDLFLLLPVAHRMPSTF